MTGLSALPVGKTKHFFLRRSVDIADWVGTGLDEAVISGLAKRYHSRPNRSKMCFEQTGKLGVQPIASRGSQHIQ